MYCHVTLTLHIVLKMATGEGEQTTHNYFDKEFDEFLQKFEENEELEELEEIVSVHIEMGSFKCMICSKICKSEVGLKLHTRKKHKSSFDDNVESSDAGVISVTDFRSCLIDAIQKVVVTDVYPQEIINGVKEVENISCETLLPEILKDVSFSSGEKFYGTYYRNIIRAVDKVNATGNFHESALKIVLMKTAELIFIKVQKYSENQNIGTPKSIDKKQLAALQYIGGYILNKTSKKLKLAKNTDENQQALMLVQACTCANKTDLNQRLITALDRGGLSYINDSFQKILVVAEKYFTSRISNVNLRSIPFEEMAMKLCQLQFVRDTLCDISENIETKISNEVMKNVIFKLLHLYLKVRSFSYAKDHVEKYKVVKEGLKKKSLRKELKTSTKSTD